MISKTSVTLRANRRILEHFFKFIVLIILCFFYRNENEVIIVVFLSQSLYFFISYRRYCRKSLREFWWLFISYMCDMSNHLTSRRQNLMNYAKHLYCKCSYCSTCIYLPWCQSNQHLLSSLKIMFLY